MTVEENLAFGSSCASCRRRRSSERVERVAKILRIEEFLKRKPRALSGGQRQRVALGRAIVREPQAFLMDEPLSNLDAKLRVQMRAEIHQLQRRLGVTTIYVTHDQVEAMTMGDRVAVMNAAPAAGRHAAGALRPAGQRVRRRLHRLAVDEPRRVGARAEQRQPRGHRRRAQADRRRSARPQPLGPRRLRRQEDHPRDQAGGLRGRGHRAGCARRPPNQGHGDLTEPLGSEVLVHFGTEATAVVSSAPAADAGEDADIVSAKETRSRRA